MQATVRALMEQLIDYAGMFPPARLPLAEALHHYARLAGTTEAWMLGRFVCPVAQLEALLTVDCTLPTVPIAALARSGQNADESVRHLAADVATIAHWNEAHGDRARVEVVELTLPAALTEIAAIFETLPRGSLRTFLEVPLGPAWQDIVQTLCQVASGRSDVALKIRCGGQSVPSIAQLAFFIACCQMHRVAWKATAGLHHPLRHRDPATQQMAHGFLNVFLGGVFANIHGLDATQLAALLQEESPAAFRFTDEHIAWRDWRCTLDQVRRERAMLPAFGSCSFDEPRDDLRALGLLP